MQQDNDNRDYSYFSTLFSSMNKLSIKKEMRQSLIIKKPDVRTASLSDQEFKLALLRSQLLKTEVT